MTFGDCRQGLVYRVIATHLARQAGFSAKRAHTGAVTLIQRFGAALNLNMHVHMLFLDGVYVEGPEGGLSFRWVKAPTGAELTALASRIASRVGRFLERQGLLERDRENPCLAELALDDEPMEALLAHSITYRIAVGPRARRARCLRCRAFPATMSRPVRRQARSAASVCMRVWRRGPMSAASSSGYAATSAARRCRRRACRSLRAGWCAPN